MAAPVKSVAHTTTSTLTPKPGTVMAPSFRGCRVGVRQRRQLERQFDSQVTTVEGTPTTVAIKKVSPKAVNTTSDTDALVVSPVVTRWIAHVTKVEYITIRTRFTIQLKL
eukprot:scaffold68194_cov58-Attheya_sp.AAC.9